MRGVLVAYISRDGAKRVYRIGNGSFHDAYVGSPPDARYMVTEDEGEYVVYDMWRAMRTHLISEPLDGYIKVYNDLDVAIAATIMTYKDTFALLPQLRRYNFIKRLIKWGE